MIDNPNVATANIPELQLAKDNFADWVYSKNQHFDYFKAHDYDLTLYGKPVNPLDCNLKDYQDLLTYGFIKENYSQPIKMLDIGGGDSRILNFFKDRHECWNIDKLEGVGNGPLDVSSDDIKLVKDYIGEFSRELPDNYFDFVFSISVFEHVDQKDRELHQNIVDDIRRILKPGGKVLHALDCLKQKSSIWTNPILRHFYEAADPVSGFVDFDRVVADPDLYTMSECFYNKTWKFTTEKTYQEFGSPLSYNFCSVKR